MYFRSLFNSYFVYPTYFSCSEIKRYIVGHRGCGVLHFAWAPRLWCSSLQDTTSLEWHLCDLCLSQWDLPGCSKSFLLVWNEKKWAILKSQNFNEKQASSTVEAAEAAGALGVLFFLGSSQKQPSRTGCCVTHRVHSDALQVLSCLETKSTTLVPTGPIMYLLISS